MTHQKRLPRPLSDHFPIFLENGKLNLEWTMIALMPLQVGCWSLCLDCFLGM